MKGSSVCGTAVIPYSRAGKERDDVRKRAKKGKEKKAKTIFEGNDNLQSRRLCRSCRAQMSNHYSRERGTCRQTIREQPSLKFTAEALASTRSQALYQLASKDEGQSEKFEGWFP